jgi:hypothetical protein
LNLSRVVNAQSIFIVGDSNTVKKHGQTYPTFFIGIQGGNKEGGVREDEAMGRWEGG